MVTHLPAGTYGGVFRTLSRPFVETSMETISIEKKANGKSKNCLLELI